MSNPQSSGPKLEDSIRRMLLNSPNPTNVLQPNRSSAAHPATDTRTGSHAPVNRDSPAHMNIQQYDHNGMDDAYGRGAASTRQRNNSQSQQHPQNHPLPTRPVSRGRGQPRKHVNHHVAPNSPYAPHGPRMPARTQPALLQAEQFSAQCQYMDDAASHVIPTIMPSREELMAKDTFRVRLEAICREVVPIALPELPPFSLQAYGSFASGFAVRGSDLDLTVVWDYPPIPGFEEAVASVPRILEAALLQAGLGARVLDRTRVPIIKVCEHPTPELYHNLVMERQKWDTIAKEEEGETLRERLAPQSAAFGTLQHLKEMSAVERTLQDDLRGYLNRFMDSAREAMKDTDEDQYFVCKLLLQGLPESLAIEAMKACGITELRETYLLGPCANWVRETVKRMTDPAPKPWLREKAMGDLDFPKTGVGIQCDINFTNSLAIHNTRLLRCYSLCDVRVRPMVLFVKEWARRRKINSAYSGTLSSYGYVLMVLHYLIHVAKPPVLPNLLHMSGGAVVTEQGYKFSFYDDEDAIRRAAAAGNITTNTMPLGVLLRNFFHYYGELSAMGAEDRGFNWTRWVLSLRSPHGLLWKEEKGWTAAKNAVMTDKVVRQRYLLAIEDPFETDHNVARTVTHNGIVAIRDEFRRALSIMADLANKEAVIPDLFEPLNPPESSPTTAVDAKGSETNGNSQPASPALSNVSVSRGIDHVESPLRKVTPTGDGSSHLTTTDASDAPHPDAQMADVVLRPSWVKGGFSWIAENKTSAAGAVTQKQTLIGEATPRQPVPEAQEAMKTAEASKYQPIPAGVAHSVLEPSTAKKMQEIAPAGLLPGLGAHLTPARSDPSKEVPSFASAFASAIAQGQAGKPTDRLAASVPKPEQTMESDLQRSVPDAPAMPMQPKKQQPYQPPWKRSGDKPAPQVAEPRQPTWDEIKAALADPVETSTTVPNTLRGRATAAAPAKSGKPTASGQAQTTPVHWPKSSESQDSRAGVYKSTEGVPFSDSHTQHTSTGGDRKSSAASTTPHTDPAGHAPTRHSPKPCLVKSSLTQVTHTSAPQPPTTAAFRAPYHLTPHHNSANMATPKIIDDLEAFFPMGPAEETPGNPEAAEKQNFIKPEPTKDDSTEIEPSTDGLKDHTVPFISLALSNPRAFRQPAQIQKLLNDDLRIEREAKLQRGLKNLKEMGFDVTREQLEKVLNDAEGEIVDPVPAPKNRERRGYHGWRGRGGRGRGAHDARGGHQQGESRDGGYQTRGTEGGKPRGGGPPRGPRGGGFDRCTGSGPVAGSGPAA